MRLVLVVKFSVYYLRSGSRSSSFNSLLAWVMVLVLVILSRVKYRLTISLMTMLKIAVNLTVQTFLLDIV